MQTSGIVLLNKPPKMGSTACVSAVKRAVNASKAGHLGTLDSLGAGVLPIALGKSTRIFDQFLKKQKTYRAIFKFGVQTDTLDADGTIVQTSTKTVSTKTVLKHLPKLVGEQEQLPPDFSAKKIAGKRASDHIREGKQVELKRSKITIYSFDLIEQLGKNLFLFEITCSAGTYIRSLCRDLAKMCGSCGTMVCIIRTQCGMFDIEQAQTLEQIKQGQAKIIATSSALSEPILNINYNTFRSIIDGKKTELQGCDDGNFQLHYDGQLVATATICKGELTINTFFGESL